MLSIEETDAEWNAKDGGRGEEWQQGHEVSGFED